MSKQELVSYMAGLLSIMESKETAGLPRGNTLAREYNRAYDELKRIIEGEENEARSSEQ